ncbi:MAG TPA: metallophosphoesterase family protein [Bryobacteraceae bacterium]|nr:metallophosphoesterase family protein [Bryobacteraceae bacterium]
MRAVVLSDIHANYEALKALDGPIQGAQLRICLGDFIGYYCQVNEVLDFVRARDFLCVRGNHDHFLTAGYPENASDAVRFGIDYADRVIASDHRKWLAQLPLQWAGFLDGQAQYSTLLCHGSPWNPLEDYLYADSPMLPELARFTYDLIAFGQTHRPLLLTQSSRSRLNPGSVGQSRHRPSVACAAVIDDSCDPKITLIEVPYDSAVVSRLAVKAGAGEWIHKHL